jgi:O-antigen/teichoic acid export membrane protein
MNKARSDSRFLRQASLLMFTQTVCKFIPLVANLLVLKLYSPEIFGQFGLLVSWMAVASSIGNLSLDNAVISGHGMKELRLGNAACLISSAAIAILQILISIIAIIIFNVPSYFVLIGIYTYIKSVYNLQSAMALKFGHIKVLAWSKLIETLGFNGLLILLGIYSNSLASLIICSFISVICGVIFLRRYLYIIHRGSITEVLTFIKRYKHYPIYISSAALIEAIVNNFHIVILSLFYDNALIGALFWVQRILNVPLSMLVSINQLIMKRLSDSHKNIPELYIRIAYYTKFALVLIFAISLSVLLITSDILDSYIPAVWHSLVKISQVILPVFLLGYLWKLVTPVFYNEKQHKVILIYDVIIFILSTLLLLFGGWNQMSFIHTLTLLTILRVNCSLVAIVLALILMRRRA